VQKPRVVVVIEYYLPGFKGGGPMRSVSALVEQLGNEIDFYIITRDRDHASSRPYPDIRKTEWTTFGKARVLYLAPDEITARRLVTAVRDVEPRAVYLNSFFATMTIRLLLARRIGALDGVPILLAPRGELSSGALQLKAIKKHAFLKAARWMGLHDGVKFQASTEQERDEILSALPWAGEPYIARNPVANQKPIERSCPKQPGAARFVFLSRIDRKKNLHLAIGLLASLGGSVVFDIYGPIGSESYWAECQAQLQDTPPHVSVTYGGPLVPDRVAPTLARYHFFLLPTAGENFGHAIVEALRSGCPVIASDRTPWRGLPQRGAGWDLPLSDPSAWREVLQSCVDMDAEEYEERSLRSRAFGHQIASIDTLQEHRQLFRALFEHAGDRPRTQVAEGSGEHKRS
jgi:glycosyltransferase involved in cell wall biosynthesis